MAFQSSHKINVFHTLKEIEETAWNSLSSPDFPFSDHAFLLALETSGSVGEKAGWIPFYVTVSSGPQLVGALYLYLKNNSYGEYIFDWEWARASHASGIPYYPKIVSAVPFTPATGPKLLIREGTERKAIARLLIQTALELVQKSGSQSLHFLFVPEDEVSFYKAQGLLERFSFQYHWKNRNYANFSDFISKLKKKKGKQILREREQLKQEGLSIKAFSGSALSSEKAQFFYKFYSSTIEKMGAIPYLTPNFFETVFEKYSSYTLLHLASRGSEPIAGSLSYFKGKNLFGRYWGAKEEVRNLHFELCYYAPIEFAIERKLEKFEAGAQGEHKIQRGFLPELTFSAHTLVNPFLQKGVLDFLEHEKREVLQIKEMLLKHSPYQT